MIHSEQTLVTAHHYFIPMRSLSVPRPAPDILVCQKHSLSGDAFHKRVCQCVCLAKRQRVSDDLHQTNRTFSAAASSSPVLLKLCDVCLHIILCPLLDRHIRSFQPRCTHVCFSFSWCFADAMAFAGERLHVEITDRLCDQMALQAALQAMPQAVMCSITATCHNHPHKLQTHKATFIFPVLQWFKVRVIHESSAMKLALFSMTQESAIKEKAGPFLYFLDFLARHTPPPSPGHL